MASSRSKVAVLEQRHVPEGGKPDLPASVAGKLCRRPGSLHTQQIARHGYYLRHQRWYDLPVQLGREMGLLKGNRR